MAVNSLKYLPLRCLLMLCLVGISLQHALAGDAVKEMVMLTTDPIDSRGQPVPMPRLTKFFEFIERDQGIKIQHVRYSWPRALIAAESGEGVLFGVSKTRERERLFHFSLPVHSKYIFLVTRNDATFKFNSVADLKGKTIGIPRGISFGDDFDALKDNLFTVEPDNNSPISRVYKLLFRRMDAGVFSSLSKNPRELEARLQKMRDAHDGGMPPMNNVQLSILPKPLLIDTIHFAVRSDKDDGIIDKLNAAILKAKRMGLLAELR
ncbi:transporter substrate-binding domain-containing protein [Undibacterium sp. CY18W]|uniref:Transporter substrate-binding domain-containing protein n=1 Tax=Undibacterium hunanense TaxID=2762292 RepID=A0ABR6ZX57_9BURK|nr:transporter substrate-binding domain-containing protein [Undibacterium hunanense]MBC3920440.1 transporter substrate-binding domain-containing protein [Undibacterium hunanense]